MKTNKKDTNGNGNGNGFVATIEKTNGNGNGAKKAKAEELENPVETVEDSIKITPHFNQLTTKGVEMYRNMDDIENAYLFIDDLVMTLQCDSTEIAGVMMLLEAIKQKVEDPLKTDHPVDFIGFLQDRLFSHTVEFDRCSTAFVEAVKSGNFVVEKLIDSESKETVNQPAAKKAKPTTKKDSAGENFPKTDSFTIAKRAISTALKPSPYSLTVRLALLDLLSALASASEEGVHLAPKVLKWFKEQKTESLDLPEIPPEDFDDSALGDTIDEIKGEKLALAISGLLNNQNLPSPVCGGILTGLNDLFNELHIPADDPDFQDEDDTGAEYIENLFKRYAEEQANPVKSNNIKGFDEKTFPQIANDLNAIFYNENVPHTIVNCLADGIFQTGWDCGINREVNVSAEFVEEVLRTYWLRRQKKGSAVPKVSEPSDSWDTPPEIKEKNSLKVSDEVYEALSKDADRCLRTPENQLAVILESYFSVEIKTAPETSKSGNLAETLEDHYLQVRANKIKHILESDNISDEIKSPFYQIIYEAANEANIGIDHPELINTVLPLIFDSLNFEYGKGIYHAIGALLDSVPQAVKDEIEQYHVQFESPKSEPEAVAA